MRKRKLRVLLALLITLPSTGVLADEGGVSFWLPGQFGALAAVPTEPGWAFPLIYNHTSANMGANQALPRGGRGRVAVGVDAKADLIFGGPSYTFANPVLGGQAGITVMAAVARTEASADATLTGPRGRTISAETEDSLKAGSDLYPLGTLKWNRGMHNFMVYGMGGIPVGAYDPNRLVNLGLGHAALDAGGGYTYFDQENELSAVAGVTYNWENTDTNYQNGIDSHLDWSASHFVTPQTHLGLVGYVYHQLTGDSGSGAVLGDFKSRVSAVGPQVGHFFKVGKDTWYVNLKGYDEFAASNRAEGWNVWLTLAIPLSGDH